MKLTVKNFRNIKSCQFEIIDNMLVLVGKNGVGKSNVLEAIKRKSFTTTGEADYEDIVYIGAELSIDDDIEFSDDSVFFQLANILYANVSEEKKYELLLRDVNCIIKGNDYLNEQKITNLYEDNLKKHFFRCCAELASGFKRKLFYRLLYRIAIEVKDKKLMILIDSPELYAHPSMARMFCNELKFLSEKGHLVIVSTHNANVMETLISDIRQISKLTLENGMLKSYQVDLENYTSKLREFFNTKNIYYLPNGRVNEALVHIIKENLDSFCKSFIRESVLKMLFADYILLGEGASEEVLFNYIFTKKNYNLSLKLSEHNMDYISGFGKFYLPFYFILANLYDIKVICLYDIDNLENKSHRAFYNAFNKYELSNKKSFATVGLDPDLEHVLEIEQSKHRVEKPLHIFNEVFYRHNNVDKIVDMIEKALNML